MNAVPQPTERLSAIELYAGLKDYRLIWDASYQDRQPEQLFHEAHEVFLVTTTFHRKVYAMRASAGIFFLKISAMVRKKDQWRFSLLPWRMKSEWRNLSRLKKKGVTAPERVLFGFKGRFPNHGFFIITKDVRAREIDCRDPRQVLILADCLAGLHARGIWHRDLHPGNILLDPGGQPVVLDAQEIYFLPWLPRRLRAADLGQLYWHLTTRPPCPVSLAEFIKAYNAGQGWPVSVKAVEQSLARRRQRYYRSRAKRCCKNSSEFQIIDNHRGLQEGGRGFKRRDFSWTAEELQTALARGTRIKDEKLIVYENVCVKVHRRRHFHQDRALASWKMARALSVRGIATPQALAYFSLPRATYFLSVFHDDSLPLNVYFSTLAGRQEKKTAIKRLAQWLRSCHDLDVWQRDFKSTNVLVRDRQFLMVDLEGVKIRDRLPWRKKRVNLAQLNASVSDRLTLKDRLRFYHYYHGSKTPSRAERRRDYQAIWRIGLEKNTLPFGLDLKRLHP